MPLPVSLTRISYTYPDGTVALGEVSLEVAAGETFGLLGPNGAGKSTLLLHLNGILRGAGSVRIGDFLLRDRTLPAVRRHVGLLFQNPDDQLFMASVYDDVAFGPRNQGLAPDAVRQRVEAALEVVGMAA